MKKWTRKRIIDAFIRLVSRYGYEDVSVEMILKESEISKTTFYRYFKDKADVMDARFRTLYDEAVFRHDVRSLQDLFTVLLQQSKENGDQYAMFSTTGYNSYTEFVYRYTFEMGKEIMEKAWGRESTPREYFHISTFCAGGSKIMQEWAMGKQFTNMTAAEIAGELCTMIHPHYLVRLEDDVKAAVMETIQKRNGFK